MPGEFPQHTETALQGLFDECLADASCKAAFPNVREEARAVLAVLRKGPVEVEVAPPPARKPVKVKLSRDLAGEAVRYMLYQSGSAGRIPLYIHLASQGNYAPLATAALMFRQRIVGSGATGLYLSITCAEDVPFVQDGPARTKLDDTFLGDYRYRQMREACNEWPRGEVEKDYFKPVRSSVPVLITTGRLDPVTPPLYGDRVAKGMPNSLHVVVPSGGHGFSGLEGVSCIDDLIANFVIAGSLKGLDISCVRSIRRQGFMLKLQQ
jgi:pimeloyl-ACP methyl ester carboxylesterase